MRAHIANPTVIETSLGDQPLSVRAAASARMRSCISFAICRPSNSLCVSAERSDIKTMAKPR